MNARKAPTIVDSFNFAFEGIIHVLRTQRNLRIHFAIAFVVLVVALIVNVTKLELIALLISITFVLIATANAIIVGYLVFANKVANRSADLLDRLRHEPAELTLVALVLTVIAVIATKAYTGRGTPLRGGVPSGHAAVEGKIPRPSEKTISRSTAHTKSGTAVADSPPTVITRSRVLPSFSAAITPPRIDSGTTMRNASTASLIECPSAGQSTSEMGWRVDTDRPMSPETYPFICLKYCVMTGLSVPS